MMTISVVIPVRDEAESVGELTREIVKALETATGAFEIIYVDDGSADATCDVLRALPVRVIRHPHSYGQSQAVMTGVRAARHDHIVVLDGDGQNDPKDIPALVAALQASPSTGMVIGFRQKRQDNAIRRISSCIAAGARRLLLKDATRDSGCGLKILKKEVFLRLPYFDHMHRFMPSLVKREGLEVVSIPVSHRSRRMGRTKYTTWSRFVAGMVDLFGVMWLMRRKKKVEILE